MSATGALETAFKVTSTATNDGMRQSDVFELSGMPVVNIETGETDVFVLQLEVAGVTLDSYLGWLNPETNAWVNAVAGNFGGTAFFAGDGAYNPATDFNLGTYGVDIENGTVWAVLNHNSEFATVPEPGTYALIALGLGMLFLFRRRRPGAAYRQKRLGDA